MKILRKLGLFASETIIGTVHVARYSLAKARGAKSSQGARIMIVDDRRVLLVSHWYAPFAWTLPGGGVDKDEKLEDAAMREAFEETGLKVNSIAGEIGTYQGPMGKGDKVTVFYTGDFEGSLQMTPNLEIMARSWFDMDNLPDEVSPGNRRRIEAYRDGKRNETGRW